MAPLRPTGGGDGDRPAEPPKRRRAPWLGGLQIAIVAVAVIAAFFFARAPGADDVGPSPHATAAETTPLVRVIRPQRSSTVLRVAATGSVDVRNHVALTPQVGGRVVRVSPALRAGGAFAAGEELLVIDRRDFELAQESALANVAGAEANLKLQEAQSEAARINYSLLKPGERVPPLVAKEPQIAQAKAQLAAARAQASTALLELQRTTFALPFAGRVAASSAEVGQVLTRGQPFGQSYALDALEVVVPIAPDDLARIAPAVGRSAVVRVGVGQGLAESAVPARVERRSAELDPRTRFATLYLAFADGAHAPVPGTFVDVEIEGPAVADTYLLPEATEQTGGIVWVVHGGALSAVAPRTVARLAGGWLVAAFDAKDGVVTGAVPGGREGLAVEAAPAAGDD